MFAGLLISDTEQWQYKAKEINQLWSDTKSAVIDHSITTGKVDARIALFIENPALRMRID